MFAFAAAVAGATPPAATAAATAKSCNGEEKSRRQKYLLSHNFFYVLTLFKHTQPETIEATLTPRSTNKAITSVSTPARTRLQSR